MQKFAYDLLSIPSMSAEDERVFSETGQYISDNRYSLGADIVEALECNNRWIKAGICLSILQSTNQSIESSIESKRVHFIA